eukprot:6421855-Pyramimonas_sp.AAC.1
MASPSRHTACPNRFEPDVLTGPCLSHRLGGVRDGNVVCYRRCHVQWFNRWHLSVCPDVPCPFGRYVCGRYLPPGIVLRVVVQ